MAEDMMRRLASEQRKRFVAGLLGAIETSAWYDRLAQTERRALREKVLVSVGTYHDFMLDVIKVGDAGTVNEHALTIIQAVHDSQRRLERRLAHDAAEPDAAQSDAAQSDAAQPGR